MTTESVGGPGRSTRGLYADFAKASLVVAVAFVAISAYSFHVQTVTLKYFGDGDEYSFAAQQIASREPIRAEAPYVYRIALPWLVARTFPARIELGFQIYNMIAAAVGAALLLAWLRAFAVSPGTAALTAILYVAAWIGPARFVYYYPVYVDPPFIAFAMGALLLMRSLRQEFSWPRLIGLTAVCFVGALVRETMLIPSLAFLFVNVRLGAAESDGDNVPLIARLVPLVAALVAIALCRQIPVQPRRTLSAVDNAVYLFHTKPLFTLPLAMFKTFGPVLAVVLYDWRAARAVIARNMYLAVFFFGCFAAGYIGGHETERYLIWGAPAIYLLVAIALQNHRTALLRSAWVFVLLVLAQAFSAHVFFGFPDPGLAVADWVMMTTFSEKLWGVVNRLLVVDDFSWNMWSYFGSRPFHALELGIYSAFSAALILYLRWAERTELAQ